MEDKICIVVRDTQAEPVVYGPFEPPQVEPFFENWCKEAFDKKWKRAFSRILKASEDGNQEFTIPDLAGGESFTFELIQFARLGG